MNFDLEGIRKELVELANNLKQEFNDAQLDYYILETEEPKIDLNIPVIEMEGKSRDSNSNSWYKLYYNPQIREGCGRIMYIRSDMSASEEISHEIICGGFYKFIGALRDDYLERCQRHQTCQK